MPETPGWQTETSFDLLEYSYIEQRNFSVLMLLEQRIRDYLNEGVQGIDHEVFARNQQFYRDPDKEQLRGYHLVYRDPTGLVFVRDDLWKRYMLSAPK